MASEAILNAPSSMKAPLSVGESVADDPSQKDTHRPTVEEVIDEEDILHPPPSAKAESSASTNANGPESIGGPSGTADGRQTSGEAGGPTSSTPVPPTKRLDVTSEEAFPALGASKGPVFSATSSNGWGKKPVASNGVNGKELASGVSSRSSTPSGTWTPASPAASQMTTARGGLVNLPGRHQDYIQFAPAELAPPNQLRTSRAEIIREINRKSKAHIEMKTGGAGSATRFVGTGPPDAVRAALREVASRLGSKQTKKVPVPAFLRPYIIGKGGATIKGVMERTGARIQVPRQDEHDVVDEDTIIDIVIEGDAVACGLAKRDIETIVNDKTSTVNLRLKDIPPEYFPFLAGPGNSFVSALEDGRNVRVQIPQYYQWTTEAPVLPPSTSHPAVFSPQAGHGISISGDRQQAQQVQAHLETRLEQLQSQLTMDLLSIERARHQFIVGSRGLPVHKFLEETGCTVILPPPGVDSDDLFIVGPAEKINEAADKVVTLASSMNMTSVDVARQHAQAARDAQSHARNVTRYLRERQAIEELERLHNATIVFPESRRDAPTSWNVFAQDGKNNMRARSEILNLINGHPPSRIRSTPIDPFFHQQIQQQHARRIRQDHGVHVLFPSEEEAEHFPDLVLIFEAPGSPSEYELPRRQPSAAEAKEFERALAAAEEQLLQLIAGQEELSSREIEAKAKFHDKARRYVAQEQSGLPTGSFPVQIDFGQSKSDQAARQAPKGATLRGPTAAVDEMVAKLVAYLQQEEEYEKERGFTTSFDFPSKYANLLIGKRGENINALKLKFDVDIQAKDEKVTLTGPQVKCDLCKKHILKSLQAWEDEKTLRLIIGPEFHRDLIGAKGAGVNRLQDRYAVRINFPKSARISDDATDAGTEAGSVRGAQRPAQRPDEVVIKGPSKGVDSAAAELYALHRHYQEHNFTHAISVSQEQIPRLIGQGGREMDKVRVETDCQIDVPNARDAGSSGRVEIKLKGSEAQVKKARAILEAKVREFDNTVVETIEVDKKYHRAIIGSGGTNIRDIVVRCGGSADNFAKMVRFPQSGSTETTIRVEGPKAVVEKIVKEITEFASLRSSQVTRSIDVPLGKHRQLIGRGGETRKNLESQFNINLDIPRQGSNTETVKISGQPADVEKAKAHIESLVKEQEGLAIQIPKALHHQIADNGQFFRRLRSDHRVIVDHDGMQPPAKQSGNRADPARGLVNGGNLPLITDEPGDSVDAHRWQIVNNHAGLAEGAEADTIPWILRNQGGQANPESLAKAMAVLEKALEEAKQPSVTGYLTLPNPNSHRFVIGPGGASINSVRRKTACQVMVPKGGSGGGSEAIEITGQTAAVEQAKDLILQLVKEGESGRRA